MGKILVGLIIFFWVCVVIFVLGSIISAVLTIDIFRWLLWIMLILLVIGVIIFLGCLYV